MSINLKDSVKSLILLSGIIIIWRGIWGLLDLYLFPNDPAISHIFSIIIGLVILIASGELVERWGLTGK